MASLFQSDKYVTINTADTTTNGYYVIKFISKAYTMQNNTTFDKIILLWMNYLSMHNVFATCKTVLLGIGNNIHCNSLS